MTFDDMLQDAAGEMPYGEGEDADPGGGPSPSEDTAESSSQPDTNDTSPGVPTALCENCQAPLLGSFCHRCGQSDRSLDLSFGAFVRDWLGSVFGFDGRVWRTLSLMLLRPGRLSHEYLKGRRASYVSPLRLYFFVSLAAFLILTITDSNTSLVQASDQGIDGTDLSLNLDRSDLDATLAENPEPLPESEVDPQSESETTTEASSEALDSTHDADDTETSEASDNDFQAAVEQVAEKAVETAINDNENLSREFARNLPKAVFCLVPFYALLLKIFFRRRFRSFLQHLVVSLHLHTTAFVLITLGHLVDVGLGFSQQGSDPGQSIAGLILIVHTFMSLRHVYGDRRRILLVKYGILSMAHITALGMVMLINLFFAFYRMGAFE